MATKLPAKKTAEELQVDCEVAAEVIAEYTAYCAKELAAEREKSASNPEKIAAFESQLHELKREKMSLGIENSAVINKAIYIYAPLLKKSAK